MTPEESGRKGGENNRDNHSFTCPFMKKPCVIMVQEYFAKTGSKGGNETLERHGREHYVKAGKMGGWGNKKKIPAVESSGLEIQEGLGVMKSPLAPKGVKD